MAYLPSRTVVRTFKVLNGDYGVPYISDHYPIAFTFRFAQ